MRKKASAQSNGSTRMVFGYVIIFSMFFGLVLPELRANQTAEDSILKVYLPREVTVKDKTICLGEVGIIRGEESLVDKAGEIALGRFSIPGQKVIINRPTVLSRLACNEIPVSRVILTGADSVTVKQQHKIIKAAEFIQTARLFLQENLSNGSFCQADPVGIVKDFVILSENKDVQLGSSLAESNVRGQAKVRIGIFTGGVEIGKREVTFRLKYTCRRAVTVVAILAGALINSENIKVEEIVSDNPEPAGWEPPYGLIARRRLAANTVIGTGAVGQAESPVVIERNQTVTIRVESRSLLVTAIGRALEKGRVGEYIRVRNEDSKRIIFARVSEDGTVKPVF